ncbi:cysteine desulfurase-like protein [Pimelobacter simplex]|uniref:Cysteine desulfurase n=1 Tax=Nocardioides simplex TaxID=2045 RepID=A0A0A1DLV2_NOCSI|nr:cysteine desulfurase-like protein [Pimelobacter simplex]AIY17498.1 Cysteine desulfurase [Pimelobacter simplex]MCG8149877.1 cysteine desulfurase-like protein [Pimelobacter simplex]GEB13915.1 cysteine desulfurase-like protein [Pimelobacter simplex]SFM66479.1 cysteine desulfurase family protein, VC1184 subfamily [Pimelobacter simplex]
MTSYDVARLRSLVPALADGTVFLDGPGGTQTPAPVADAMRAVLLAPLSNRGSATASARNADAVVQAFRSAVGDLVGATDHAVVAGRSATQLAFDLARTIAAGWAPGDEVVVSTLDHDSNIRPWVLAAAAAGAVVRRVDPDPATGEIPVAGVAAQLSGRTRLVALTGASNLTGTRPDLTAIAALARAHGAQVWVDGVHLVAHAPVDLGTLDADFLVLSPYKVLGPHCGVLVARRAALAPLRPAKLAPSTDALPERFELGTLPYELLAGTTAVVDLLASLTPGDDGDDRRTRVLRTMTALEAHEDALRAVLEEPLHDLPGVRVWSRAARRTPTLLLTVEGRDPHRVVADLAARGVCAAAGTFYADEGARALGLPPTGGLRLGLAPYSDRGDVDRALDALTDVLGR